MKRVIRYGVFETNSSSMHAICIRENVAEQYTPAEITGHVCVYNDGTAALPHAEQSFGRAPFEMLFSLYDKCRYAIAAFGEQGYPEIRDIFTEAYNDARKKLPNVMKSEPECIGFDIEDWDDPDEQYYGNIDHQSQGLLEQFLKNKNISLKEFLLNPKYMIVIDGDEYNDLDRYKSAGLINGIAETYISLGISVIICSWNRRTRSFLNCTVRNIF